MRPCWNSGRPISLGFFARRDCPSSAPPPLLGSSARQTGNRAEGPRILSPKSDLTYQLRLTGSHDAVLDLEAAADGAHDRIYWFIDSAYLGVSPASSPLPWQPVVGRHVIRAVDQAGRADSRVVTVDAVE